VKRVLIAEDNELLANLWSRALAAEKFEVVHARDGEEVVTMAQASDYDLILMDIMMPKLDGLEACRRIQEKTSRPPKVIFVSCLARSADIAEANSMRAADFLVKGRFSLAYLVTRVATVLEGPFNFTPAAA